MTAPTVGSGGRAVRAADDGGAVDDDDASDEEDGATASVTVLRGPSAGTLAGEAAPTCVASPGIKI
jgi:hypothetical protein